MASMIEVRGVGGIREALRKADVKLAWKIRRGLIKGGMLLQRLSQQVVPIDTSNLKNSAGTKAIGHGWSTDVIVYYTAHYAVYVHERTDLQHAEGKQAKFLEGPARKHRDQILKAIASEAKL
jgi:hypothetical protein